MSIEEVSAPEAQERAFASQWQLMWMRFRRHHLALAGGVVLIVLYGVAAFCEFVAPYEPAQRNAQYVLCPPQWPHFVDAEGSFHLVLRWQGRRSRRQPDVERSISACHIYNAVWDV